MIYNACTANLILQLISLKSAMATSAAEKVVNGNYSSQQGYGHAEAYQPGQLSESSQGSAQFGEQHHAASAAGPTAEEEKPIPKEMIGWYFVEQYYNTMSKEPGNLHVRLHYAIIIRCRR